MNNCLKSIYGSGILHRDTPTGNTSEQGTSRLHHWVVNGDRRISSILRFALVLSLILCGCRIEGEKAKIATGPLLPPMPWNIVQEKKPVRPVEELFAPSTQGVVIQWENQATPFASNYVTGIEATADFQQWEEVARLPYTTTGIIQLTNRTDREFYRIYNSLNGM